MSLYDLRRSVGAKLLAEMPATIVAIPPPNQRVKPRTCTNNQNPRIKGSRFRMDGTYKTRRTDAQGRTVGGNRSTCLLASVHPCASAASVRLACPRLCV